MNILLYIQSLLDYCAVHNNQGAPQCAPHIGETERNLIDRMEEHAKISGAGLSAVGEHLKANPGNTVNLQSTDILGSSPYRSKLLIKVALYIQQYIHYSAIT